MTTERHVENVVIEEPSDKNETLPQEKPCFTKKHLYITIGVVFIVAISLIGSLLDFSPADSEVNEQTIREGTLETWPEFDANNDGFIDQAEYTSWASNRIAQRRRWVTPWTPEPTQLEVNTDGTNTSNPIPGEVNNRCGQIDLNGDGRISRDEAIAFALRILERIRRLIGWDQPILSPMVAPAPKFETECAVPSAPGFPGRSPRGWVAACKRGYSIWCYSSEFCRNRRKCGKSVITTEWTTTDTCCGTDIPAGSANCTTCSCGGTYTFVPAGRNARLRSICHWLSELHCGDYNTGVPVW
jgi:hypothetical protein